MRSTRAGIVRFFMNVPFSSISVGSIADQELSVKMRPESKTGRALRLRCAQPAQSVMLRERLRRPAIYSGSLLR
jgi:hypothetical protein